MTRSLESMVLGEKRAWKPVSDEYESGLLVRVNVGGKGEREFECHERLGLGAFEVVIWVG